MTPAAPTDEPITLPSPSEPPRRGALPIVAAFVPMVGAVAMWLVTGSALMLCFAALGPLMALASLIDGARGRRRERRRAAREMAVACEAGRHELRGRHDAERAELSRSRPDAAALVASRTLWRQGPSRLVLGRGRVRSGVRVSGGEGPEADGLKREAAWVDGAPVDTVLSEAGGVCVQAPGAVASAIARAFAVQLCLRASPDELRLTALLPGDEDALSALPHAAARAPGHGGAAERRGSTGAPVRVAMIAPGRGGERAAAEADFVIAVSERGAEVPAACGVILESEEGTRVRRLDDGAADPGGQTLEAEALSRAQAARIAGELAGRAAPASAATLPPVDLADVLAEAPSDGGDAARRSLAVPIGRGGDGATVVDLVHDGPHAVVVGITGSGKSELLRSWIVATAATHPPERVAFLLADFKGGTAFVPLAQLPHVSGIITDLDGAGARRAVESLRAELRRREAAIAAAGAADVADPRVDLPRLVIVVDEFAALLQEHEELGRIFTDVAARGRALGMHLVLGTQRAAGVMRDALLANCPLRVALRTADAADSRAVLGVGDAAELPGDAASRGTALVRRAGDAAPERTRVCRVSEATIDAVRAEAEGVAGRGGARAPWLPPLPAVLTLDEVRARAGDEGAGRVLLGVADEPDAQRQTIVGLVPGEDRGIAVIGGAGAGKSAVTRLVAAQAEGAVVLPADPEGAWDAMEHAVRQPPRLLVIDGIDALLARFPPEYAQEFAATAEAVVRDARATGTTAVVTAGRLSGPVERIVQGLPTRALLRAGSRADHLQAGGDGADHDPARVPGRAVVDGREVQFAWVDEPARNGAWPPATRAARRGGEVWRPARATALVTPGAASRTARLAEAWGPGTRVVALDAIEPGAGPAGLDGGAARVVVAGDGESWLRHGGLLRRIRAEGDLLVAAECPHELRALAGERALPPFALTRARRAWIAGTGEAPRRVVLPA